MFGAAAVDPDFGTHADGRPRVATDGREVVATDLDDCDCAKLPECAPCFSYYATGAAFD